jgi:hypothetical protein
MLQSTHILRNSMVFCQDRPQSLNLTQCSQLQWACLTARSSSSMDNLHRILAFRQTSHTCDTLICQD